MRHGLLHTMGIWRCGRHVARGLSKGYLAQGKWGRGTEKSLHNACSIRARLIPVPAH